jgi:hypothetical protein
MNVSRNLLNMTSVISTRFLIISDTHDFQFGDAEPVGGSFKLPVPRADVILHSGDLTMKGGIDSYMGVLKMMEAMEAELKLVIAGNHDLSLDKEYWRTHHDRHFIRGDEREHEDAIELMTGPEAQKAGVTYLEEGINTFKLKNGAEFTIYTSPYQPEFCDMAFPYQRTEDRFNPPDQIGKGIISITKNPVPDHGPIDIMMTHGPPQGILDLCASGHVGCSALQQAVKRCKPRLYCFGHIHEGHGASLVSWIDSKLHIFPAEPDARKIANAYPESNEVKVKFGEETLMVNAAIMNVDYRPVNQPWLVDLDLRAAE